MAMRIHAPTGSRRWAGIAARIPGAASHSVPVPAPRCAVAVDRIAARIEQVSGSPQLNMDTLYPALMRLEQRGLIRGKWRTTETNRRHGIMS
jgi:hypothetical protein